MTVCEAFKIFKGELELPDRKQQQASTAQQEIRSKIAEHLYVANSFLTGSYARYTKIDPLNDIDVFLVHNSSRVALSSNGGISPSQAIDRLAAAVGAAYPNAAIKKQSRSVNVTLSTYSFGFDLVPAWLRNPDGYWIPDTDLSGSWLPSDPQVHADLVTQANKATGETLVPVIKMIKHWSRNNLDSIRSFHIELICRDLVGAQKLSKGLSYPLAVATVLVYLPNYIGNLMLDPVYLQSRVDKQLPPDKLGEVRSRISYDSGNAIEALRLEAAGDQIAAVEKWKHIFVFGFPK
jgi:hypothetical protein